MPELPEVETIGRCLSRRIVGLTIRDVRVLWPRSVAAPARKPFLRGIKGRRITRIFRRGKHLVFALDHAPDAGFLVSHLRMSGRWLIARDSDEIHPHTRVHFDLDHGKRLLFVDPRKFGRLWHVNDTGRLFAALGPEPLERRFTAAWLAREMRARKRALKPLLLDQSFIAGLGNIYVDESLHVARLHPLMPADLISRPAVRRLHAAIQSTLRAAIRREGSSFDSFYRTPEGNPGRFQNRFRVYGRRGEPCRRCGAPIRRIVVAQRGTHICPKCQPELQRSAARSKTVRGEGRGRGPG